MAFVLTKCAPKLEGHVVDVSIKTITMPPSAKVVFLMFWCKTIIILRYLSPLSINIGANRVHVISGRIRFQKQIFGYLTSIYKTVVYFFETINKFRKKNRVVWDTLFYTVVNRMLISCHELLCLRRLHCLGTQDFH